MLGVIVAHREQHAQKLLLALRWKVGTHRETTVIEPVRGRQDGVLVRINRAILCPRLPVEIEQRTGIGLPCGEALKRREFPADMVPVLADHEIKAPDLDIPLGLQTVALQHTERDECGLGRVFRPFFNMIVVSYMSSGALSVALSDLPTAPKTVATSGKERMIRSCSCIKALA